MDELKRIENELNSLCNRLFYAEDPAEMDALSENEKKILKLEISELEEKRKEIYKSLYEEKLELYPNVLNNPFIKNIIAEDYYFNYLFMCLVENNNIIDKNVEVSQKVCNYLDDYSSLEKLEKINKLLSLSGNFFKNDTLLDILSSWVFNNIHDILESDILLGDDGFVDYLLIQVEDDNIDINTYYYNIKLMEQALTENLPYNVIFNINKTKNLYNNLEETLDTISMIENDELRISMLSKLFDMNELKNKEKFSIFSKFINIEEVRKQLVDENSLYYYLLISSIKTESNESYARKEALFNYRNHIDWTYQMLFDETTHYFDTLVSHYIYYYEDEEIRRVPILAYIEAVKERFEKYSKAVNIVYGIDTPIESESSLLEKYKDDLSLDFKQIGAKALGKNTNKELSNEEISYWDYLMDLSHTQEDNQNQLTKIKLY